VIPFLPLTIYARPPWHPPRRACWSSLKAHPTAQVPQLLLPPSKSQFPPHRRFNTPSSTYPCQIAHISDKYDPDRFLFQQSPHYLACNRKPLATIISYARRYYHLTHATACPSLDRLMNIAEFLTTRLWLAQEIQSVEDRAVDQQLRCSRASTFRCGDAWVNDWYLYWSMSRAVGEEDRARTDGALQGYWLRRAGEDGLDRAGGMGDGQVLA
jgi:hypothetical protein